MAKLRQESQRAARTDFSALTIGLKHEIKNDETRI
jgi:hypothetical protein